uniref:Uncharacterized protein n=1 Tax=viral metagenome TaxID=1070528 RepID=A0A6M3LTJ4_9ZZZZ
MGAKKKFIYIAVKSIPAMGMETTHAFGTLPKLMDTMGIEDKKYRTIQNKTVVKGTTVIEKVKSFVIKIRRLEIIY